MVAMLRTIGDIVRLRSSSSTRTRRPVRPDAAAVPSQALPTSALPGVTSPRRRRPSRRIVLAFVALLVLLAALATAIVMTMPRIDAVEPETLTNDATPTLELRIAHPAGVRAEHVLATVDGARIDQADVRVFDDGRRIELRPAALRDGEHDVDVQVRAAGLLRRTLHERWSFTVDTTPPPARIISPVPTAEGESAYVAAGVAAVTTAPLRLTVGAEVGSTLRVSSDAEGAAEVRVDAGDQTRRTVDVPLPEGAQLLTVLATDEAGNTTRRTQRLLVDTKGPALLVRTPRVVRDNTLALPISARDAHGVSLQVTLDGSVQEGAISEVSVLAAPAAAAAAQTSASSAEDEGDATEGEAAPEAAAVLPLGGRYLLQLEDGAFEGRHVLEVTAIDSLGTRTVVKRSFFVDSGEELADVTGLRTGARGRDVVQLHQALIEEEVVARGALAADIRTRTYGAQTRSAVQRYQQQQGMDADGVAGADTIAALTLRIVIDRGANTLTLYRVGDVVKTYRVATGAPEFPTPAGDFRIQTMQVNPTWTPPDSEWAKDAEVIPPGPDNPLGTRWMAIDGTVGIHGTNNPASIGGSVSHGCIRMHIPDVEELYSMVEIGTRVTVV